MVRTSITDPLRIAQVSARPGFGRIGLTLCPGKKQRYAQTGEWNRDLDLDLAVIKDWGAAAVVTLLESQELEELRVTELGVKVRQLALEWFHLPIKDGSTPTPEFERAWATAGERIRAHVRNGSNVLVHCKGGLGRAGMIGARLLVELGMEPKSAIEQVRRQRPRAIETNEQEAHVTACTFISEPQPGRNAVIDRAKGALLGLAVGDAVGTTLEFKPRDDNAPPLTDMIGGGPFRLRPGQWTDDTAMALALADSLLAQPDFDPRDLLTRFVSWWREGRYSCTGTCFDIGITTEGALTNWLRTGDPQAGPVHPRTAGNGSLMRLAPVAIRFWREEDQLKRRDVAAGQSRTTHGADEAVDACILFADILADAIAGRPRSVVLRPRSERYRGRIDDIAKGSWRAKDRSQIRGSGYVVHALEAALWCVGRTSTFKDAVLLAANLREDADTTAAITGQLAGALYGESGIPEAWRQRVAMRDEIVAYAERLAAM